TGTPPVLVVTNFTPVPRTHHRIGVPEPGRWIERLNTNAEHYGGDGAGNLGGIDSEAVASDGRAHSLKLNLPPLTTLFFELHKDG
ncbi:MAG: alpha amylase C-terminal domain-containing protein, partial [Roseobacter sp.]